MLAEVAAPPAVAPGRTRLGAVPPQLHALELPDREPEGERGDGGRDEERCRLPARRDRALAGQRVADGQRVLTDREDARSSNSPATTPSITT